MPKDIYYNRDIEIIDFNEPQNYRDIWKLQLRLNEALKEGSGKEALIFVEHLPVYTLGFHGNIKNFKLSNEYLNAHKTELIRIERGGDITYHGPGQLVVYPIINLISRRLGVKNYVAILEEAVIRTCAEFHVHTARLEGKTGVWCECEPSHYKKICAIGIKVSHGVTMHGLAFNVSNDLKWYDAINPCGFSSNDVTSIEKEIGDFKDSIKQNIKNVLKKILLDLLS